MSKYTIHTGTSRGHADHGWLKAYHSFSFASYYHPERVQFGALRVLNDDTIAAGMGFGMHPHNDMEIITIPLEGDLAHKDSMGNESVIKQGDVQVMSAGTGVYHSEFNPNDHQKTQLLQIWVFPNQQNVTPRYQQLHFEAANRQNQWQQIVSPHADDAGTWIHQNAWFYLGDFDENQIQNYTLHQENNGVYLFVISGAIKVDQLHHLGKRDAIGISETTQFSIECTQKTSLLLMEIPL